MEQVQQGDKGLGHKVTPKVKSEVLVHTAKASDEIVLESSDSLLGSDGRGEARVGSRYFRH